MNRLRQGMLLFAVAVFVAMGCKKNEADQTADWTRNIDSASAYATKYPAFKRVIEKTTAEAQAAMDAAKAVTDKDKRTEAMGAANHVLTDLTDEFASYESASKSLNDTLAKHAKLPESLERVTNSAKEAQKAAVGNMTGKLEPSNVGVAKTMIEDSIKSLKAASDAVASTDAYLSAEKTMNDLLADKELASLPADKVSAPLEAAKTAQRNAGYALMEAGGAPPEMAKNAVVKATKILNDAAAPLKALKPAPAAAAKPDAGAKK